MKVFTNAIIFGALIVAGASLVVAQNDPAAAAPAAQAATPAPITETKATIYIYRIKQFANYGVEPSVYVDDKELARMDNGRYFGVTLDPGKHTFRMGDKQTGFEVDMKAGQVYYAKVTIETGFWKGHGRLTYLQPEQGAFEIKSVKLLSASKVRNSDLVTIFEGSSAIPAAPAKKADPAEKTKKEQ